MPSLETGARSLKVAPIITPVHSDAEVETAIIALGHDPTGGLVVMPPEEFQVEPETAVRLQTNDLPHGREEGCAPVCIILYSYP